MKHSPQPSERSAGLALHCADRVAEDPCDLRFRQPMPVTQHDHCALAMRETPQCPDKPISFGNMVVDQLGLARRLQPRSKLFAPMAASGLASLIVGCVNHAAPRIR